MENANNTVIIIPKASAFLLDERYATTISKLTKTTRFMLNITNMTLKFGLFKTEQSFSFCLSVIRNKLDDLISYSEQHTQSNELRLAIRNYTKLCETFMNYSLGLVDFMVLNSLNFCSLTIDTTFTCLDSTFGLLDNILGSTECSKTISIIIQLIKNELLVDLNKIGVKGATKSMIAFVFLQLITGKYLKNLCLTNLLHRNIKNCSSNKTFEQSKEIIAADHQFMIKRFVKFSVAKYGLVMMNYLNMITFDYDNEPNTPANDTEYTDKALRQITSNKNIKAFVKHTGIGHDDIVYSSFNKTTSSQYEMSYTVCLDHITKSVVVTIRGTSGVNDLLIDLLFEYKEIEINGTGQQVHNGMYQTAKKFTDKNNKMHEKIKHAMQTYRNYGLVLCGHSLGGAVASLIALMLSYRASDNKFLTCEESGLPVDRTIHCFTYGSPSVVGLSMSKYMRSLVTTVVNEHDIIPYLSLGSLRDFRNVCINLSDEPELLSLIIKQATGTLRNNYMDDDETINWYISLIKTIRANMNSDKLYPPGDIYVIKQNASTKRTSLMYCNSIEMHFMEPPFSKNMLSAHIIKEYDDGINMLSEIQ